MNDIHSHIRYVDGSLDVKALLADMDRFSIQQRIISYLGYDELQKHNRIIAQLVRQYPERLKGCALINPLASSALEDVRDALTMSEIVMIEFNSYEHGYSPDACEPLFAIFDEINKKKLPVKIFSGLGAKGLPQQWESYIKRYPDISFIFLHIGCFDYGYGCVDMVKQYPNAFVETSNQYELQILRKAFGELPINKILFGSSYPERFTRSAIEVFDLFDLSKNDLHKILYENAAMIW